MSLIVSAGIAKASIVSSFVGNFLLGAGILIVGGLIKQEITTTVQCTEIEYVWQVYDFAFRNDSYVYGYKYLITETGDNYGEIHYDGITPKDWGTTAMAYAFYYESYTFSNWTANSWYIDSQNIYI